MSVVAALCLFCLSASAEPASLAAGSNETANGGAKYSSGWLYFLDYLYSSDISYTNKDASIIIEYGGDVVACVKVDKKYAVLMRVLTVENAKRDMLLKLCNEANEEGYYGVKCYVDDDNDVIATYEFIPRQNMTSGDWEEILSTLDNAADYFLAQLK